MRFVDSRDIHHCPVLFSRSTDFSSPLREFANFVVRVYVSIVSGGSLTKLILSQNSCCVATWEGSSLTQLPILSLPDLKAQGFSEIFR
jgi:hypothetical protein